MAHPFVSKLRHGAPLTSEEEGLLSSLAKNVRNISARKDIMVEGEEPRWLPLILDGWACRYKVLENGRRQITSVFIPGDLCEPFGVLPRFLDDSLSALTPVTFSPVSLDAITQAAAANSNVREALWWDLLVNSAMDREHLVGLGRRSATERMGHLFCEMYYRLNMVGLVQDMEYEFPLTQVEIADLLGLSTVHTNRSIKELRRLGLISARGRKVRIRDLENLRELSLFDDAYFHFEGIR